MSTQTSTLPRTAHAGGVLPIVAALVTMILWASAFIAIRAIGDHFDPGSLALGRLVVGAVALGVVAASGRLRVPRGRALALVAGYGVLWFGVYTMLVNAAERHLDAGTTALLINVAPILIAVLAGVFLAEGFPGTLVAGLAVAFSGVAIISFATSNGRYDAAGVAFALAAAALYAVGVLLQKQALQLDTDPFSATFLGCAIGAVACIPFGTSLPQDLAAAPLSATVGVVYLGLFPTAIAFSTWAYALARTDAGRLSASSYLVPALAVLMSWLLLSEVPAPLALAGGALCLAGVAVTRLPSRR